MRKKKLCSLLLCAAMAAGLAAGCGLEKAPQTAEENSNITEEKQEEEKVDTAGGQTGEDSGYSGQEPYTVRMLCTGDATAEACERVAKAASEITEAKFNTTIEITRVGFGSYAQQVRLLLSSNEKLDLVYAFRGDVTSAISNGQFIAIDDVLEKEGQDILETVLPSDWQCMTVNGQIYGVPNNKEHASGWGFGFNKKMADAIGYDYSNIKTEAELEPMLQAIKEAYPDVFPVVAEAGSIQSMVVPDDLGGDVGVLKSMTDGTLEVVNLYETQEYFDEIALRYDWAQKGLIMPDASTNTEGAYSLLQTEVGFGRFTNTKPGIANELSKASGGMEIGIIELVEPYTSTTRVDCCWYIPRNCEQPVRAMQILNEMYSNPELANLLTNGCEGIEWDFVDKEKGIINYPEGKDSSSTEYTSHPWAWPNECITYVWEGDDADVWEQMTQFNENALISPAKGFTWDNSGVQTEAAAVANVISKYGNAFLAGSLDPAVTIPQFIEELKDAGADTIIEEKQRQLDAWHEENG